jgi:hypothetical protein
VGTKRPPFLGRKGIEGERERSAENVGIDTDNFLPVILKTSSLKIMIDFKQE